MKINSKYKIGLYTLLISLIGITSYKANAQSANDGAYNANNTNVSTNNYNTTLSTNAYPGASKAMSDFYGFYREHEISFDAFVSGAIGQQTIDRLTGARIRHDGRLGAGLGANVFFCRYIGVGADAYSENTTHAFVDNVSGNLIFRLPIADTGLAPYVFGGGGYQFDPLHQSFGQAGAGLEFRFLRHAGLFVDGRYVMAEHTDNYGVARGGLRINF